MLINVQDTPQKAIRIFDRLVETFKEQDINPSPLNYYVWYQYVKGNIPALRQEMDSILHDPFGYNDRVGKRLYDTYLLEPEENTNEFDRAFRRLIDAMVKKMDAWSDKLESHTQQLDECSTQLSNPNLNSEEIQRITNTVITAASSIKEGSLNIQNEMIRNAEAVKDLRKQLQEAQTEALTDELTQIGNRKSFNHAIEELIQEAQDTPENLCLILCDIDHFKQFNDTYGHLVGDSVLRYFAKILQKEAQKFETICRYGGEEFVILLANSSLEEAIERANNVREAIQSAQLKRKNSSEPLKTITASFGVASYHGNDETAQSFIDRADKALYMAKESGRNCVIDERQLQLE
ncbi:MAG: GGDEF domain-containing protein [Thiomicrorhabdus sp.]|nr:GGDEF domain-containing protein [Thiomicrorhabdus sp.]